MSVVKTAFVRRLKCLRLQYSQSFSFILPAHDHSGIISCKRIGKKEREEAKRSKDRRMEKKKNNIRQKDSIITKEVMLTCAKVAGLKS